MRAVNVIVPNQRSRQLIELANRSLFSLHDQLERTPGATEARRVIVRSTLEYLDKLAADAADDPQLLLVAASGYYKLGDVLGAPLRPNLGDRKGALEHYMKAEQLLKRLLDRSKWDMADRGPWTQWIETQYRIASLSFEMRQTREAISRYEKALASADQLLKRFPGDPIVTEQAGNLHLALTEPLNCVDSKKALEHATQAVTLFTNALANSATKPELVEALATAHGKTASAYLGFGRPKDALPFAEKSAAMRERLVKAQPNDVLRRRDLMLAYARFGDILGGPQMRVNLGDTRAALEQYQKAVAIAEALHAADARNKLSRSDLAAALTRAGIASNDPDQREISLSFLKKAAAILDELVAEDPNTRRYWLDRGLICEYMGYRLQAGGDVAAALAQFEQSLQIAQKQLAADPQNNSQFIQLQQAMHAISTVMLTQGNHAEALRLARESLEKTERHVSRDSAFAVRWRARSLLWLGNTYEAIAKAKGADSPNGIQTWREALDAYERSQKVWSGVSESEIGALQREEMATLPARIAQCQSELQRLNARR
jgi:tetratricopeptide (TPR) repeat protein